MADRFMRPRTRKRETDTEAFGAEALPGGLHQIDEARGQRPAPQIPARVPLLGLAALLRLWRSRGRRAG